MILFFNYNDHIWIHLLPQSTATHSKPLISNFLLHPSPSLAAEQPAVYAVFNLGEDPRSAKASAQGLKLMQFVDGCVNGIDDLAAVQAKIDVLAHRHTGYGVKAGDFAVSCTY